MTLRARKLKEKLGPGGFKCRIEARDRQSGVVGATKRRSIA
jgi:hypothetical protein